MLRECIAKHQLSGVDERDRGFSRQVSIERVDGRYMASLRYESTFVATDGTDDECSALAELVRTLHAMGYGQLRTQRNFSGGTYLGTQETSVEYPDPEQPNRSAGHGLLGWMRRIASIAQRNGVRSGRHPH